MNVLVTGAAGFLGSHIAVKLARQGHRVICLDDLSRCSDHGLKMIRKLDLELHVMNVMDPGLSRLLRSVDVVVHSAAYIDVEESILKPTLYVENNVLATTSLAEACIKSGVSRMVFVSSAAVYGEPKYLPIDEDHPLEPISPYGASKVAAEVIIKSLSKTLENFKYTIVRPFNIYGPGQSLSYSGVIVRFGRRLLEGLPPIIYGDGEQTRDFIYVEDVAEAIKSIIECRKAVNKTYNIGSGVPTRIIDLSKKMMDLLGVEYDPIHEPPRPGDIRHSYASINKIRREVGWSPKTTLIEGLKKTIEWLSETLSRTPLQSP